jgi:hypothetical protein
MPYVIHSVGSARNKDGIPMIRVKVASAVEAVMAQRTNIYVDITNIKDSRENDLGYT